MQFGTWYFNLPLFRSNLRRYWPIWSFTLLAWVAILPLRVINDIVNYRPDMSTTLVSQVNGVVVRMAGYCGWIAAANAIVCVMAVFSYLFQHKAVVAIHGMPLRRECLFITNYLSGLAMMVGPMVINLLISLAVEGVGGCLDASKLLMWFTAQLMAGLFFYSFAVLCTALTGNIIALVVVYGGLQAVAPVLKLVLDALAGNLLYGFSSFAWMEKAALWLSPFMNLGNNVIAYSRWVGDNTCLYFLRGWKYLIVYTLVSLVFALAALLLYRIRRMESAGDIVAIPILRPVFLYGFTVVGGLTVGYGLNTLAFGGSGTLVTWGGMGLYLGLTVLGGFVCFFVAQMLLKKTVRVFQKGWLGLGVTAVCMCLFLCAFKLDVLRFEGWTPTEDQVESVSVQMTNLLSGGIYNSVAENGCRLSEKDSVEQVIQLHQSVIDKEEELLSQVKAYESWLTSTEENEAMVNSRLCPLKITYTLTNGDTITRAYSILINEESMYEGSVLEEMQTLVNLPEYTRYEAKTLMETAENSKYSPSFNFSTYTSQQVGEVTRYTLNYPQLDDAGTQVLLEAVVKDLKEGRGEIQTWVLTRDVEEHGDDTCWFQIVFSPKDWDSPLVIWDGYSYAETYYTLCIDASWSNTMAALEELGVIDETHKLVTVNLALGYTDETEEIDFSEETYNPSTRSYQADGGSEESVPEVK